MMCFLILASFLWKFVVCSDLQHIVLFLATAHRTKYLSMMSNYKVPFKDGKVYFSYAEIHHTMNKIAPTIKKEFDPNVIIAVGGGGFIPARILRTYLKVPILSVSLELYNDKTNKLSEKGVVCHQWFDPDTQHGKLVEDGRVLIVDEVDDTRTTLQYCVEQVLKRSNPSKVAVCVVHNKIKEKMGSIPPGVEVFAGETVPDYWNCYPWDAGAYGLDISLHEEYARQCSSRGTAEAEIGQLVSSPELLTLLSTSRAGRDSIDGQ